VGENLIFFSSEAKIVDRLLEELELDLLSDKELSG
jgi:hypothetical protein